MFDILPVREQLYERRRMGEDPNRCKILKQSPEERRNSTKMRKSPHSLLFFPIFLLFLLFVTACHSQQQVYIIYLGEHREGRTAQEIHDHHSSFLLSVKNSEEAARKSLVYSYKKGINGFAAFLSEDEAATLSEKEGVVFAFPSQGRYSLHTTRTWEFIGIEEGLIGSERERMPSEANYGENVIVGVLDSGIWPESESFDDNGMGPIPKRWKGICEEGDGFNSSCCNKKLIGARYYIKGYEAYYGPLNTTYSYRSPRDGDGHGTHTASTVVGRVVHNVSALGGFALGTASGGAPLARLAIYKVCWPIPGPNPNLENTCFDADMLAAFDDAVADGVDIISMSIGPIGKLPLYSVDSMSIGSLHATKRGIVVACSGGNEGPDQATVVNLAPWMITVGATTIDRAFDSNILLGSGKMIEGQTVTPYELPEGKMYPLVYAGDVEVADTPSHVSGQCLPGSLSIQKASGKIVLCFRGAGLRVEKGMEVKRVGGAAIILGNGPGYGDELVVDAHVLPGTAVTSDVAMAIMQYINSTEEPTVTIGKANTALGTKPAPLVGTFSSRGPNRIEPNILKPDVTAPGLNILAAWSESSSPSKLDGDHRSVKYNIMYGTSMACPHVSATAALIKALHPTWSSAAIRSAIMTTATGINSQGNPITTAALEVAGPMDIGSGHIRPSHSADPGLIYDATYTDYLLFACSSINAQMDPSFPCPTNATPAFNLNHPSVTITGLCGTAKVTRTVTNVSKGKATYKVSVTEPNSVKVEISPEVLSFEQVGEKKSFTISLTVDAVGREKYVAGEYIWSDGVHIVRSPILVSSCENYTIPVSPA